MATGTIFAPFPIRHKEIGSGANLNSLTADGFYTWGTNQPTNVPISKVGYLLQISQSAERKAQVAVMNDNSTAKVYARVCEGGNWGSWAQL